MFLFHSLIFFMTSLSYVLGICYTHFFVCHFSSSYHPWLEDESITTGSSVGQLSVNGLLSTVCNQIQCDETASGGNSTNLSTDEVSVAVKGKSRYRNGAACKRNVRKNQIFRKLLCLWIRKTGTRKKLNETDNGCSCLLYTSRCV